MKKNTLILVFLALLYCFSDAQIDCNNLPKTFLSYSDAISKIKSTNFKVKESVNTSRSSWIRNASYFSCNNTYGYLILKTDKKEYIHVGVPYSVWKNFRKASSFGSFYVYNIKNKYRLYVK